LPQKNRPKHTAPADQSLVRPAVIRAALPTWRRPVAPTLHRIEPCVGDRATSFDHIIIYFATG
jgi:hypothetical protein